MPSNSGRAFIGKDQFLEMVYVGNISQQVLDEVLRQSDVIIEQLKTEGVKPLLLANITHLKKTAQHARKNAMAWVRQDKVVRIAVYGNSLATKYLVNFMAKAINRQKKFRYFSSRDEAEAWLKKA